MNKTFLQIAALLGALGLILGAFGAHGLKQVLDENGLKIFETAVRYQFYHVFALALTGILYKEFGSKYLYYAGWMFIIGIIFFSGSLYIFTYKNAAHREGLNWVGPITPIGGVFFIIGWICLAFAVSAKKIKS
jgi:uncharacterized membrane protein YgdD (TMEM256/DUF423 family)